MPNRSAAHTALVRSIMAELGAMPGVVIADNPSGVAQFVSDRGKVFYTPYGWPVGRGSPDVLAVVAPLGRLVALECKTGKAVASAEQSQCHEALRRVGVVVAVVRSVEEAKEVIMFASGGVQMFVDTSTRFGR